MQASRQLHCTCVNTTGWSIHFRSQGTIKGNVLCQHNHHIILMHWCIILYSGIGAQLLTLNLRLHTDFTQGEATGHTITYKLPHKMTTHLPHLVLSLLGLPSRLPLPSGPFLPPLSCGTHCKLLLLLVPTVTSAPTSEEPWLLSSACQQHRWAMGGEVNAVKTCTDLFCTSLPRPVQTFSLHVSSVVSPAGPVAEQPCGHAARSSCRDQCMIVVTLTFFPNFFSSLSFRAFSLCSSAFCRLSKVSLTCAMDTPDTTGGN